LYKAELTKKIGTIYNIFGRKRRAIYRNKKKTAKTADKSGVIVKTVKSVITKRQVCAQKNRNFARPLRMYFFFDKIRGE
jgi:hypothetical protein